MKNIFKLFGIIAFVVVIGFSFATCEDQLGGDEDSFRMEGTSASSFTITNRSSYEINVTVKDSNYKKESKTIASKKSVSFYSLTPPVTVTYSPVSKVKRDNLLLGGVYFENR